MLENLISASIWACQALIWATIFFFFRFQLYYMLEISPSCNPVQYQGKIMIQNRQNEQKSNFACLDQIQATKIFI